jgi:hypothetical protein
MSLYEKDLKMDVADPTNNHPNPYNLKRSSQKFKRNPNYKYKDP